MKQISLYHVVFFSATMFLAGSLDTYAESSKYCLQLEGKHRRMCQTGQCKNALVAHIQQMKTCRSGKFAIAGARWAKDMGQLDLAINLYVQAVQRTKETIMKGIYKSELARIQRRYRHYVRQTLAPVNTGKRCRSGVGCKGGVVFIRKPLHVRIMFQFNSDQVLPEGRLLLNDTLQVIKSLLKNRSLRLQVIGHTDRIGSLRYNKDLSKRRALNVLHFLRKMGIGFHRMKADGMAFLKPNKCRGNIRHCNRTAYQRQQNRRVEFKLSYIGE